VPDIHLSLSGKTPGFTSIVSQSLFKGRLLRFLPLQFVETDKYSAAPVVTVSAGCTASAGHRIRTRSHHIPEKSIQGNSLAQAGFRR